MEFDHIGYVVKDMEKARKAFEAIGFLFENIIVDDARKIYICFGVKDSIRIELISPAPACAFHGRRVAFLYHLSAGIIEFVET